MEGYIYDYRLGYIRANCTLAGFDVYGSDDAPKGCIVTLGGYTTPEQARDGRTWAECLYNQYSGEYQILSGCTDGYSSAQILTMFIREVILLKPKLVICLSGFYNIAYKLGLIRNKADAVFLKTHPFATPGHLHFYRKITSPFGLGSDEVYYGMENYFPAWELWLRHMSEIKCLCDEFGIELKAILQPCVFSGKYRINERERTFIREHYMINDEEIEGYRVGFQREYAEIAKHTGDLRYSADISGVFDACEDVYDDACHVSEVFLTSLTEGMTI